MVKENVKSSLLRRILNLVSICRRRKNYDAISIFSMVIRRPEDLSFLEDKDNRHDSWEKIGQGGFGAVYKMELPNNPGKIFAIKVMRLSASSYAAMEIESEISTIGLIRHRNLVPLLAHVAGRDCHFLIYEFLENGSLEKALRRASDGSQELNWLTRHKIAMGIAAGLEYLHTQLKPEILHRDLQPSNILLDDDMEARITDFGLAVEDPDTKTERIAGTLGYMAPEYLRFGDISIRCDIYSFGVVLATLVSGKFPRDVCHVDTPINSFNSGEWLRNVLRSENPSEAIDPVLMGNGYERQMLLALKIAYFCTASDPEERPNITHVRLMLSEIQP